jgi:hypothetical protein
MDLLLETLSATLQQTLMELEKCERTEDRTDALETKLILEKAQREVSRIAKERKHGLEST